MVLSPGLPTQRSIPRIIPDAKSGRWKTSSGILGGISLDLLSFYVFTSTLSLSSQPLWLHIWLSFFKYCLIWIRNVFWNVDLGSNLAIHKMLYIIVPKLHTLPKVIWMLTSLPSAGREIGQDSSKSLKIICRYMCVFMGRGRVLTNLCFEHSDKKFFSG